MWHLQSQTVWLPRLYDSIPADYTPPSQPMPPKGVGFTDPLSGTLMSFTSFPFHRTQCVRSYCDVEELGTLS